MPQPCPSPPWEVVVSPGSLSRHDEGGTAPVGVRASRTVASRPSLLSASEARLAWCSLYCVSSRGAPDRQGWEDRGGIPGNLKLARINRSIYLPPAVYERGPQALRNYLLGHDPGPHFLPRVPGLPGSGSVDVMENLSSSCTGRVLVN